MKSLILIIISLFIGIPFVGNSQVKDIDGNVYKTVKIGNQIWMAENLRVTHFRNGEPIPKQSSEDGWFNSRINLTPAWCNGDNDLNNSKGSLYNAFTITDQRGIAPEGWHIPSMEEVKQLESYLGAEVAAQKMKSTTGWNSFKRQITCPNCENWSFEYRQKVPCTMCKDNRVIEKTYNGNGTNASGFSCKPIGCRVNAQQYGEKGEQTYFWTSTFISKNGTVIILPFGVLKNLNALWIFSENSVTNDVGLLIRCIKNSSTLTTKQIETEYLEVLPSKSEPKPESKPESEPLSEHKSNLKISDLDSTLRSMITDGTIAATEKDLPALEKIQNDIPVLNRTLNNMVKDGTMKESDREAVKRLTLLDWWNAGKPK